jgi:flavin-binding protein dodecin
MSDHVYKIVELAGTSKESIEDAIQTAVSRAGKTLRNMRWFEVVQTRGHIDSGKVQHYQVILKVGFTMEEAGD